MNTIEDVLARFPDADSVGGELVVRIDNETIVLADLGNGSFNLTPIGLELVTSTPVLAKGKPKKQDGGGAV